MIFEKGQKVKFVNPESEEEANLEMYVVEDRDNRVLVVTLSKVMHPDFQPQNVYLKEDLTLA